MGLSPLIVCHSELVSESYCQILNQVQDDDKAHAIILVITPAPTVFPLSRIANLKPSYIATGVINFPVIFTVSPGIAISVPSGRVTSPVTSVVLT